MGYLKVTVDDNKKHLVEELLLQLGCEVEEYATENNVKKKLKKVSTTMLFGKWKEISIDPENFRKKVWSQKR